jgi:predicted nucleic acid-binding protein
VTVASERPAFLDTSVIVRYLTDDPPELAAAAARLIDSDAPLRLSELVIAETAYVLTSVYEVPRAAAVDALSAFVGRANIRPHGASKARVLAGLSQCRGSRRVSFADAMLWAQATTMNGAILHTLDRRFPDEDLERRLVDEMGVDERE